MLKKLIGIIVPIAFMANAFADEPAKEAPLENFPIIVDNFYDPDKNVDGPIPHVSDVK